MFPIDFAVVMRMAESGDGEHDHDVEEHDELDRVDQIPVGHELEVDVSDSDLILMTSLVLIFV